MKYVMYCRKSTDDKKNQRLSLEAQERVLKKLAKKEELQIIKIYHEKMSAKNPGRPIFNQMMNTIVSKKADAILT